MKPKHLVFCGGGTRCLIFLQALVEMEGRDLLTDVHTYWGSSAGALLAALLTIGKSPQAVKKVMFGADFMKFRDVDISNLLSITTTWGLDDGKSLIAEIERLFESLVPNSKNWKMSDISGLNIVVSDLTTHSSIICNSKNYPHLRIVDAIRASMSLPFLFRPFVNPYDGHYWVDGGIRENFAWNLLPDDETRRESLGFTFEKSWESGGPKTLSEYMFSMIHFDEPKKNRALRTAWPRNIVWFASPPFPAWFVRFREDDYTLIETIGKSTIIEWLSRPVLNSETPEILPVSVHPCNPPLDVPQHHKDELLETHSHSPPLLHPPAYPPHTNSSQQSFRRWSV